VVERFEGPNHLKAVAYRMLDSVNEADTPSRRPGYDSTASTPAHEVLMGDSVGLSSCDEFSSILPSLVSGTASVPGSADPIGIGPERK